MITTGRSSTVGVNYSIAPEYIYPTPLIQVNDALKHLIEHAEEYHIDTNNLALAGDSAGSQIAAQMATVITNANYVTELKTQGVVDNDFQPALSPDQLKCMVLCCGGYNLDSLKDKEGNYSEFITTAMWSYSGTPDFDTDSKFKTFSVYNYVDENFPPSFITVGDADPLNRQSVELKNKLEEKGVQTDFLIYPPIDPLIYPPPEPDPGLEHEYQFNLDGDKGKYGLEALERIKAFLVTHLPQSIK